MGVDIKVGTDFHGTLKSWIKCARCSDRLKTPYPVESMEMEPVGEDSKLVNRSYTFVVVVECHGEKMRCAIEKPVYWTDNMRMHALAYVHAFVRKGPVYTCEVRAGTQGQAPGMLHTEVR